MSDDNIPIEEVLRARIDCLQKQVAALLAKEHYYSLNDAQLQSNMAWKDNRIYYLEQDLDRARKIANQAVELSRQQHVKFVCALKKLGLSTENISSYI